MRIAMFSRLMLASVCLSLLSFALLPDATITGTLKILALLTVATITITAVYPDLRGIKAGDRVSVVNDSAIPAIIGRIGTAGASGKKNDRIKITLNNGNEALGVIESYVGLISPAKIRLLYEEKLVE
ncbi:MAG: hypothetical protein U0R44_02965 [Candidatus Micrarchaeia archaeon]